ncbi:MAG: hypothetical protein DBY45_09770 [Clostridiales bacterium]|nr:MAG: hypothetical protein DBY45_09770 [Clostridiales bacterium]
MVNSLSELIEKGIFSNFPFHTVGKNAQTIDNVFIILVSAVKYKQAARKFKEFLECDLSSATNRKNGLPFIKF